MKVARTWDRLLYRQHWGNSMILCQTHELWAFQALLFMGLLSSID